jgi:hypothetical protein
MHTAYHEQEADEDHYADFVRTIRVLFADDARTVRGGQTKAIEWPDG